MKRVFKAISVLLCIVMLLSVFSIIPVSAATAGEYTYVVLSDGTAKITKATATGDVVIPSALDGYTITVLDNRSFYNHKDITSVVIPDTVTTIGENAFINCSELISVTIGNSVTSLGDKSFSGCGKLTSVTIPDSVKTIGDNAFYNCTGLTSVTIGKTVETIGNRAFLGCTGLVTVTIPDSVIMIGNSSFQSCTGLTSVTIPDSVTTIGASAFSKCSSLSSVTIPDSVTDIGNSAFRDCSGLTSVKIGKAVETIGEDAFLCCSSLTAVTISNSVTTIGNYAFSRCSSLTTVTIPKSVTTLGNGVFSDCIGLNAVMISDIGAWCAVSFVGTSSNPLYYAHNLYLNGELVTELTIPDSVKTIGNNAFCYCTGLTSVTIPDSVTTIGASAFSECSGLTSVTIPDSVTSIGASAFSECSGLTSVTIPDSVTSIGNYAFYNCSSLTSVTIPDSVTSIGNYAFYNCSSLTSVTIFNSITTIGEYTFYHCDSLIDVYFEGSQEEWKKVNVKTGNTALKNATIHFSVGPTNGTDEEGGFEYYWDSISGTAMILKYTGSDTDVTIPSTLNGYTVTAIGSTAFCNNKTLESVTFPDSVETIADGYVTTHILFREFEKDDERRFVNYVPYGASGESFGAFSDCENLKSVDLGLGIKTIGSYAFHGCAGLESVTFPESLISIEKCAFEFCDSIQSVTIPRNVTTIGDGSFLGCDSLQKVEILGDASIGTYCYSNTEATTVSIIWQGSGYDYTGAENPMDEEYYSNYTLQEATIREGAFAYCVNLTEVHLGDSVTSIGYATFQSCANLKSIIIPDSVTSIGGSAFAYCDSLESINLSGESLERYGENALYQCNSLITAYINIPVIDDYMFMDCKSLKEVTLGNNVEWVGEKAFHGCINMKRITIPKSVKHIGDRAFGFYYDVIGAQYHSAPYDNYFTIQGYKNTVAELYAKENGFIFKALDTVSKPGDADGDGQITVKDVTEVQFYLSNTTTQADEETLMYADIDKNGRLEVIDTTWLQRHLAGMEIPYTIG